MSSIHPLLTGDKPGSVSAYGQQLGCAAEMMVEAGYPVTIYSPTHIGSPYSWARSQKTPPISVFGARDVAVNTFFGSDMIAAHAEEQKCDVVITFKDPYVFGPQIHQLPVPWIPLVPVDTINLSDTNRDVLAGAFRCISPSRAGVEVLQKEGFDVTFIPHGIDLDIFKPGSMRTAREHLHLPQDAFVGLFIGDNRTRPSRKNIDGILNAWSLFRQKRPDSVLMLHTDLSSDRGGVDLDQYLRMLNIPEGAYRASNPYVYAMGFKSSHLATLYQASNVVIGPSLGEGFGITTIEAQACGTPVITTAVTAMTEHTSYGVAIQPGPGTGEPYLTEVNGHQFRANAMAIVRALEVVAEGKLTSKDRLKGIALAKRYGHRRVFREYWLPFLKEINDFIMEGKSG